MIKERNENIVIIGGGYLGAMSALIFSQKKNLQVTLIEKQDQIGGLYNSAWQKEELHFDYGSRAILATGVEMLDEIVFNLLPDEEYPKSTANLKEYSYQNGQFCNYSNCLDARNLTPSVSEAGIAEMLAIEESKVEDKQFQNLCEKANAIYGPILTEQLIRPAMKKLTNLPLEGLDTNALTIHGLQRIIIADQEQSKLFKRESKFNDDRIAYARFDDNNSTQIKTYPQKLGLSDYCNRIKNYLETAPNVELLIGKTVSEIHHNKGLINSLVLEDGAEIQSDRLLWTIPSIFLARLLKKEIKGIVPPKFRNTILAHYIYTGELNSDAYYVYNYDNDYLTYRATFYDNFSERPKDLRSVTVEAFWDEGTPDLLSLEGTLFNELKTIDSISKDSKIIEANMYYHQGSWPNFALNFFKNQIQLNNAVIGDYENVYLLGKANGKHHSGALVHAAYDLYQELYN